MASITPALYEVDLLTSTGSDDTTTTPSEGRLVRIEAVAGDVYYAWASGSIGAGNRCTVPAGQAEWVPVPGSGAGMGPSAGGAVLYTRCAVGATCVVMVVG